MLLEYNKMSGVPKGFKHHWAYRGRWREKKTGKGRWKFRFQATKRTKAKAMGPKPGSRVSWQIKARQDVIKTRKGSYQTDMYGTKKLIRARMR